ncbi:MAG: thioredoxin family protein [Rhodospirillales bacterium]
MRILFAVVVAAFGLIGAALARDATPFDQAAFQAAQAGNKPIIVEIHAPWCPVCAKQKPVLSQLRDTDYKDLVSFAIDFDSQKELVARFGARAQSTLIVFKGGSEAGRSVGVSDPAAIKTLVQKAYGG